MVTDEEVYDGETVDHSRRSRALQAIFRRIDGWMGHFDLGRTCSTNSHAFYLPDARQVTSPLATVQYMDTKQAPYVEFRFYRGALAELDVLEGFEARWDQVTARAEAPVRCCAAENSCRKERIIWSFFYGWVRPGGP